MYFQIVDLLDVGSSIDLELDPLLSPIPDVTVFQQKNVKASRKKILPIIKSFLHGAKTPDITNKDFLPTETVSMATEGFTSYITKTESEASEVSCSTENPTILLDFGTPDANLDKSGNSSYDFKQELDTSSVAHASVNVIDKFTDKSPLDVKDQVEQGDIPKRRIPFDPFRNVVSSSDLTSYSSSNNPYDFMTSLSCELVDPFSSVEEPTQTNPNSNPFVTDSKSDTNPFLTDTENAVHAEIDTKIFDDSTENNKMNLLDTGQDIMNPFISEDEKIRQLNMNETQTSDKTDNENEVDSMILVAKVSLNPFSEFEDLARESNVEEKLDTGQGSVDDIIGPSSFEERAYELHQYIEDPNPFLSTEGGMNNENFSSENDREPYIDNPFKNFQDNIGVSPVAIGEVDTSNLDENVNSEEDMIDTCDAEASGGGTSEPFLDALGAAYLAARPKARKSISLIVECENTDSLEDLNESDFYDKIQTPSPGHSGSNSPFVNSGVSTPFESVSALHSLRASCSDSGYPSVTETPPNSMIDGGFAGTRDYELPSFNNAEMVARIQRKKASIGGGVDLLGLIPEPTDIPYTPRNSFREEPETLSTDLCLPDLSNSTMIQKVQEKRNSLSIARENVSAEILDFDEVKRDVETEAYENVGFDPFRGKVNSPNFDNEGFDPFSLQNINTDAEMDKYTMNEGKMSENGQKLDSLVEIVADNQESFPLDDPFGFHLNATGSSEFDGNRRNEVFPNDKSRNLFSDLNPFTPENSFVETKGQFMEERKSITDDQELLDKLLTLKEKLNQDSTNDNGDSLLDSKVEQDNLCEHEQKLHREYEPIISKPSEKIILADFSSVHYDNGDLDNGSNNMSKDSPGATSTAMTDTNCSEASKDEISNSESLLNGEKTIPHEMDLETVLAQFGPEITDQAREQAIHEVATTFAKEVIVDAIERFPEVKNPVVADAVAMEIFEGNDAQWLISENQGTVCVVFMIQIVTE